MDSTQDRIITAALSLISEQGLGAVTMIDVARTAGVARQTLYNHFADIDSIVAEAIDRHSTESIHQLRSALAVVDTPTAKIEQLVRHIAQVSTHRDHSIDLDRSLSPEHRDVLNNYNRVLEGLIISIISDGQHAGQFRADLVPAVDAALVRHLLTGISNLVAGSAADIPTITRAGIRTILAALTQPHSVAQP